MKPNRRKKFYLAFRRALKRRNRAACAPEKNAARGPGSVISITPQEKNRLSKTINSIERVLPGINRLQLETIKTKVLRSNGGLERTGSGGGQSLDGMDAFLLKEIDEAFASLRKKAASQDVPVAHEPLLYGPHRKAFGPVTYEYEVRKSSGNLTVNRKKSSVTYESRAEEILASLENINGANVSFYIEEALDYSKLLARIAKKENNSIYIGYSENIMRKALSAAEKEGLDPGKIRRFSDEDFIAQANSSPGYRYTADDGKEFFLTYSKTEGSITVEISDPLRKNNKEVAYLTAKMPKSGEDPSITSFFYYNSLEREYSSHDGGLYEGIGTTLLYCTKLLLQETGYSSMSVKNPLTQAIKFYKDTGARLNAEGKYAYDFDTPDPGYQIPKPDIRNKAYGSRGQGSFSVLPNALDNIKQHISSLAGKEISSTDVARIVQIICASGIRYENDGVSPEEIGKPYDSEGNQTITLENVAEKLNITPSLIRSFMGLGQQAFDVNKFLSVGASGEGYRFAASDGHVFQLRYYVDQKEKSFKVSIHDPSLEETKGYAEIAHLTCSLRGDMNEPYISDFEYSDQETRAGYSTFMGGKYRGIGTTLVNMMKLVLLDKGYEKMHLWRTLSRAEPFYEKTGIAKKDGEKYFDLKSRDPKEQIPDAGIENMPLEQKILDGILQANPYWGGEYSLPQAHTLVNELSRIDETLALSEKELADRAQAHGIAVPSNASLGWKKSVYLSRLAGLLLSIGVKESDMQTLYNQLNAEQVPSERIRITSMILTLAQLSLMNGTTTSPESNKTYDSFMEQIRKQAVSGKAEDSAYAFSVLASAVSQMQLMHFAPGVERISADICGLAKRIEKKEGMEAYREATRAIARYAAQIFNIAENDPILRRLGNPLAEALENINLSGEKFWQTLSDADRKKLKESQISDPGRSSDVHAYIKSYLGGMKGKAVIVDMGIAGGIAREEPSHVARATRELQELIGEKGRVIGVDKTLAGARAGVQVEMEGYKFDPAFLPQEGLLDYVQADMTKRLPLKSERADVVSLGDVLEHTYSADRYTNCMVVLEAMRILKEGGILLTAKSYLDRRVCEAYKKTGGSLLHIGYVNKEGLLIEKSDYRTELTYDLFIWEGSPGTKGLISPEIILKKLCSAFFKKNPGAGKELEAIREKDSELCRKITENISPRKKTESFASYHTRTVKYLTGIGLGSPGIAQTAWKEISQENIVKPLGLASEELVAASRVIRKKPYLSSPQYIAFMAYLIKRGTDPAGIDLERFKDRVDLLLERSDVLELIQSRPEVLTGEDLMLEQALESNTQLPRGYAELNIENEDGGGRVNVSYVFPAASELMSLTGIDAPTLETEISQFFAAKGVKTDSPVLLKANRMVSWFKAKDVAGVHRKGFSYAKGGESFFSMGLLGDGVCGEAKCPGFSALGVLFGRAIGLDVCFYTSYNHVYVLLESDGRNDVLDLVNGVRISTEKADLLGRKYSGLSKVDDALMLYAFRIGGCVQEEKYAETLELIRSVPGKYLASSRENLFLHYTLGNVYLSLARNVLALGEKQKAAEYLEKSRTFYSNITGLRRNASSVWEKEGDVLSMLGKHDEALDCYRNAKIRSDSAKVLTERGREMLAAGRKPDAKRMFERALREEKEYGPAVKELAQIDGEKISGLSNQKDRITGTQAAGQTSFAQLIERLESIEMPSFRDEEEMVVFQLSALREMVKECSQEELLKILNSIDLYSTDLNYGSYSRQVGQLIGIAADKDPGRVVSSDDLKDMLSTGYIVDYLGEGLEKGKIYFASDVGSSPGSLMKGGAIHIKGDAGEYVGVNMHDGRILVEGNTGAGSGWDMEGGILIIRGFPGKDVGDNMAGGILVVDGDIGHGFGKMRGGLAFVRGDATGQDIAHELSGGYLKILGNANDIAWRITGGIVEVLGNAASIGHHGMSAGVIRIYGDVTGMTGQVLLGGLIEIMGSVSGEIMLQKGGTIVVHKDIDKITDMIGGVVLCLGEVKDLDIDLKLESQGFVHGGKIYARKFSPLSPLELAASHGIEIWNLKYGGILDVETLQEVISLKDKALKDKQCENKVRIGDLYPDEKGVWRARFIDKSGKTRAACIGPVKSEKTKLKEAVNGLENKNLSALPEELKKTITSALDIPQLTGGIVQNALIEIERTCVKADHEGIIGLLSGKFPKADPNVIQGMSEKALNDMASFKELTDHKSDNVNISPGYAGGLDPGYWARVGSRAASGQHSFGGPEALSLIRFIASYGISENERRALSARANRISLLRQLAGRKHEKGFLEGDQGKTVKAGLSSSELCLRALYTEGILSLEDVAAYVKNSRISAERKRAVLDCASRAYAAVSIENAGELPRVDNKTLGRIRKGWKVLDSLRAEGLLPLELLEVLPADYSASEYGMGLEGIDNPLLREYLTQTVGLLDRGILPADNPELTAKLIDRYDAAIENAKFFSKFFPVSSITDKRRLLIEPERLRIRAYAYPEVAKAVMEQLAGEGIDVSVEDISRGYSELEMRYFENLSHSGNSKGIVFGPLDVKKAALLVHYKVPVNVDLIRMGSRMGKLEVMADNLGFLESKGLLGLCKENQLFLRSVLMQKNYALLKDEGLFYLAEKNPGILSTSHLEKNLLFLREHKDLSSWLFELPEKDHKTLDTFGLAQVLASDHFVNNHKFLDGLGTYTGNNADYAGRDGRWLYVKNPLILASSHLMENLDELNLFRETDGRIGADVYYKDPYVLTSSCLRGNSAALKVMGAGWDDLYYRDPRLLITTYLKENLEQVKANEALSDLSLKKPRILTSPKLRRNIQLLDARKMTGFYQKNPGILVHERLEATLCMLDAMALDGLYKESNSFLFENVKTQDELIKSVRELLGDNHFLDALNGYVEKFAKENYSMAELRRLISISTYRTADGKDTQAAKKAKELLLKAYLIQRDVVRKAHSEYVGLLKQSRFKIYPNVVSNALDYLKEYDAQSLVARRLAVSLEREYGYPIDIENLTDSQFSLLREKASEHGDSILPELDVKTEGILNTVLDLLSGSNELGIWKLGVEDSRLKQIKEIYEKGPLSITEDKSNVSLSLLRYLGLIGVDASGKIVSVNREAIEKRFPEALMERPADPLAERDAALDKIDLETFQATFMKQERLDEVRISVMWEVLRGRQKKDIIEDRAKKTDVNRATYTKYIEDYRQRGLISPDGRPFPTLKTFSYMKQCRRKAVENIDALHDNKDYLYYGGTPNAPIADEREMRSIEDAARRGKANADGVKKALITVVKTPPGDRFHTRSLGFLAYVSARFPDVLNAGLENISGNVLRGMIKDVNLPKQARIKAMRARGIYLKVARLGIDPTRYYNVAAAAKIESSDEALNAQAVLKGAAVLQEKDEAEHAGSILDRAFGGLLSNEFSVSEKLINDRLGGGRYQEVMSELPGKCKNAGMTPRKASKNVNEFFKLLSCAEAKELVESIGVPAALDLAVSLGSKNVFLLLGEAGISNYAAFAAHSAENALRFMKRDPKAAIKMFREIKKAPYDSFGYLVEKRDEKRGTSSMVGRETLEAFRIEAFSSILPALCVELLPEEAFDYVKYGGMDAVYASKKFSPGEEKELRQLKGVKEAGGFLLRRSEAFRLVKQIGGKHAGLALKEAGLYGEKSSGLSIIQGFNAIIPYMGADAACALMEGIGVKGTIRFFGIAGPRAGSVYAAELCRTVADSHARELGRIKKAADETVELVSSLPGRDIVSFIDSVTPPVAVKYAYSLGGGKTAELVSSAGGVKNFSSFINAAGSSKALELLRMGPGTFIELFDSLGNYKTGKIGRLRGKTSAFRGEALSETLPTMLSLIGPQAAYDYITGGSIHSAIAWKCDAKAVKELIENYGAGRAGEITREINAGEKPETCADYVCDLNELHALLSGADADKLLEQLTARGAVDTYRVFRENIGKDASAVLLGTACRLDKGKWKGRIGYGTPLESSLVGSAELFGGLDESASQALLTGIGMELTLIAASTLGGNKTAKIIRDVSIGGGIELAEAAKKFASYLKRFESPGKAFEDLHRLKGDRNRLISGICPGEGIEKKITHALADAAKDDDGPGAPKDVVYDPGPRKIIKEMLAENKNHPFKAYAEPYSIDYGDYENFLLDKLVSKGLDILLVSPKELSGYVSRGLCIPVSMGISGAGRKIVSATLTHDVDLGERTYEKGTVLIADDAPRWVVNPALLHELDIRMRMDELIDANDRIELERAARFSDALLILEHMAVASRIVNGSKEYAFVASVARQEFDTIKPYLSSGIDSLEGFVSSYSGPRGLEELKRDLRAPTVSTRYFEELHEANLSHMIQNLGGGRPDQVRAALDDLYKNHLGQRLRWVNNIRLNGRIKKEKDWPTLGEYGTAELFDAISREEFSGNLPGGASFNLAYINEGSEAIIYDLSIANKSTGEWYGAAAKVPRGWGYMPGRSLDKIRRDSTLFDKVDEIEQDYMIKAQAALLGRAPRPIAYDSRGYMYSGTGITLMEKCSADWKPLNEMSREIAFSPEFQQELGRAINDLHNAGILHGDLPQVFDLKHGKSANIMVSLEGKVLFIDFGMSLLTNPMQSVPQQLQELKAVFRDRRAKNRSDEEYGNAVNNVYKSYLESGGRERVVEYLSENLEKDSAILSLIPEEFHGSLRLALSKSACPVFRYNPQSAEPLDADHLDKTLKEVTREDTSRVADLSPQMAGQLLKTIELGTADWETACEILSVLVRNESAKRNKYILDRVYEKTTKTVLTDDAIERLGRYGINLEIKGSDGVTTQSTGQKKTPAKTTEENKEDTGIESSDGRSMREMFSESMGGMDKKAFSKGPGGSHNESSEDAVTVLEITGLPVSGENIAKILELMKHDLISVKVPEACELPYIRSLLKNADAVLTHDFPEMDYVSCGKEGIVFVGRNDRELGVLVEKARDQISPKVASIIGISADEQGRAIYLDGAGMGLILENRLDGYVTQMGVAGDKRLAEYVLCSVASRQDYAAAPYNNANGERIYLSRFHSIQTGGIDRYLCTVVSDSEGQRRVIDSYAVESADQVRRICSGSINHYLGKAGIRNEAVTESVTKQLIENNAPASQWETAITGAAGLLPAADWNNPGANALEALGLGAAIIALEAEAGYCVAGHVLSFGLRSRYAEKTGSQIIYSSGNVPVHFDNDKYEYRRNKDGLVPSKYAEYADNILGKTEPATVGKKKNIFRGVLTQISLGAITSSVKEALSSGVQPEILSMDPVSAKAADIALDTILPAVAGSLGLTGGLGALGIDGIEVRRGPGRCYHDPSARKLVIHVNNVLVEGKTKAVFKNLEKQGISIGRNEAKTIQNLVQTYVFCHELIHGVVRAKSNTLAFPGRQALTGMDEVSEWLAEDLVSVVMQKVFVNSGKAEGKWLAAFTRVCSNMGSLRPVFGLGKESEYSDQVEKGRRLLKEHGSYDMVCEALFEDESKRKVLDLPAGCLDPLEDPPSLSNVKKKIHKELSAGNYPENEIIRLIVTCAYGKAKMRKDAESYLVSLCPNKEASAKIKNSIIDAVNLVPGFMIVFARPSQRRHILNYFY
ncbi:MAG: methyltransferase domain-containing protein [Candidatus Altiarchaeia archaeon]